MWTTVKVVKVTDLIKENKKLCMKYSLPGDLSLIWSHSLSAKESAPLQLMFLLSSQLYFLSGICRKLGVLVKKLSWHVNQASALSGALSVLAFAQPTHPLLLIMSIICSSSPLSPVWSCKQKLTLFSQYGFPILSLWEGGAFWNTSWLKLSDKLSLFL